MGDILKELGLLTKHEGGDNPIPSISNIPTVKKYMIEITTFPKTNQEFVKIWLVGKENYHKKPKLFKKNKEAKSIKQEVEEL